MEQIIIFFQVEHIGSIIKVDSILWVSLYSKTKLLCSSPCKKILIIDSRAKNSDDVVLMAPISEFPM